MRPELNEWVSRLQLERGYKNSPNPLIPSSIVLVNKAINSTGITE